MADVTLKGPERKTYRLRCVGKLWRFKGDETVHNVPDEVARRCEQLKDPKGRKLFFIDWDPKDPDADIAEILGVQLEWINWPSSLL
jgi:hypothetical protein